VLEVVEQEQNLPLAQMLGQRLERGFARLLAQARVRPIDGTTSSQSRTGVSKTKKTPPGNRSIASPAN
jgi:hypothetical protein